MTHSRLAPQSSSASAQDLRTRQTPAEELLWRAIHGRQLDGLQFRSQHPIGPFIVDFCCLGCQLAIEFDGSVHETQQDYAAERERWLRAAGYRVLRFPNDAVLNDLSSVLEHIHCAAENQPHR